jgi:hypothetical protein
MLHIRCGTDILWKLDDAGMPGRKLSWSDPLCEGPVPSADRATLRPMRAAWLARHYGVERDSDLKDLADADRAVDEAGSEDEVVLWFEADLFDQAIMLHLLPRLADACGSTTRLTLVTLHEYPGIRRFIGLGQLTAPQLGDLFTARIDVPPEMVAAAREAWTAWVHPTPELLAGIAARVSSPMTYLPAAARRMLQELPDVRSGLSRTERQGLEAVAGKAPSLHAAFVASQDLEERPWQGDAMFFATMWELTQSAAPLLEADSGWSTLTDGRKNPTLALTARGRAVLRGDVDYWGEAGRERWLGGTRVGAGASDWRWDPAIGGPRRMGRR